MESTFEVELGKFCSEDRQRLLKPIHQGPFTYATNGKILIRVPRREGIEAAEVPEVFEPRREGYDGVNCLLALQPALELEGSWEYVSTSPLADHEPRIECPKCCGDCVVECLSCGHEADCSECDAMGVVWNDAPIALGRNFVAFWLYALIAELPGAEFGCVERGTIIPFRFEGGLGIVMSIKGGEQARA